MSKKYWKIGTGAMAFVNRFMEITSNGYLTGTKVSLFEDGNLINLVNDNGIAIHSFNSWSTANQYFVVWEALGFICKVGSTYVINTNLTSSFDLIELSKIYLRIPSTNKKVERYRETIAINVLSKVGTLDIEKINKMNYSKTRGELSMKDIWDSISKYEEEISLDEGFIKWLKEKYDK